MAVFLCCHNAVLFWDSPRTSHRIIVASLCNEMLIMQMITMRAWSLMRRKNVRLKNEAAVRKKQKSYAGDG